MNRGSQIIISASASHNLQWVVIFMFMAYFQLPEPETLS